MGYWLTEMFNLSWAEKTVLQVYDCTLLKQGNSLSILAQDRHK